MTTALALAPARALPADPAPGAEATVDTQSVVAEIQAAEARANEEPETGLPALAALLDDVASRGVAVAGAPDVRKSRILAYLTLARGYLALGDERRAEEAMHEAIRLAAPDEPPADIFGPTLAEFYAQRRAYLESKGPHAIEVRCGIPCVVYVDERLVPDGRVDGLLAGAHRLHVRPASSVTGGATPPADSILDMTILLDDDHREVVVPYAPPGLAAPARDEPAEEAPPKKRMLPVWAEGLGIGLGAAGVATGATLLALDGKCAGSDKDPATCPELYEFTAAGAATVAVGGALLVTSIVLLAVDAARTRSARKRKAGRRMSFGPGSLRVAF
ncbi:MAG: hypothetical protein D6705_09380 [Deltaproteobacteria bacterium]|nr:MAG: hypothetical protein D6705_09380 [Deltaproteobacteria bacterium]